MAVSNVIPIAILHANDSKDECIDGTCISVIPGYAKQTPRRAHAPPCTTIFPLLTTHMHPVQYFAFLQVGT